MGNSQDSGGEQQGVLTFAANTFALLTALTALRWTVKTYYESNEFDAEVS